MEDRYKILYGDLINRKQLQPHVTYDNFMKSYIGENPMDEFGMLKTLQKNVYKNKNENLNALLRNEPQQPVAGPQLPPELQAAYAKQQPVIPQAQPIPSLNAKPINPVKPIFAPKRTSGYGVDTRK